MNQQLAYLDALTLYIDKIVLQEKRHLYHLIFGSRIIGSYTTLREMEYASKHTFRNLVCVKYYPLHSLCTRIQSVWRGHRVRHDTWSSS